MKNKTINKVSQLSLSKKVAYCRLIDEFITSGNTGCYEDIAERLEITDALTKDLVKYMTEEFGCPIEFDKNANGFSYTRNGRFVAGFLPDKE